MSCPRPQGHLGPVLHIRSHQTRASFSSLQPHTRSWSSMYDSGCCFQLFVIYRINIYFVPIVSFVPGVGEGELESPLPSQGRQVTLEANAGRQCFRWRGREQKVGNEASGFLLHAPLHQTIKSLWQIVSKHGHQQCLPSLNTKPLLPLRGV